jgi:hypothetical protein
MMECVDEWGRRVKKVRRRLTERFAEEGRPNPEFCAALVVARGERGLTVEEMAAELGCGPAVLEALEQGLLPPERAPASVWGVLAGAVADQAASERRTGDPVRRRAWSESQELAEGLAVLRRVQAVGRTLASPAGEEGGAEPVDELGPAPSQAAAWITHQPPRRVRAGEPWDAAALHGELVALRPAGRAASRRGGSPRGGAVADQAPPDAGA